MPVAPHESASDADLIARAADGQRAAFTVLFARHVDTVHDHLARWSQDATLAADATQAAFTAALDALDNLREEPSLRAWLLRAARDHAVEQLRQSSSGVESPDNPVPTARLAAVLTPPSTAKDVAASTHRTAEQIWDAAAGLDGQSFSVLDLDVRHGLSDAEVAQVLDTGDTTDTQRLVREVRDRTETLFTAVLLLGAPMRDCADLETLRASAPEPVDLPVARRVLEHAATCVTCGPRRARVTAPLRTYGAFAPVQAPLPVRTAVAAAAERHFGTAAAAIGRVRPATVAGAALGLVLVASGVAIALFTSPPAPSEGPPAVVAEPMTLPSPTPEPSPTATLDVLTEASPAPAPTPAVTPEPSPSPSPAPSPSPEPIVLTVRIDQPASGAAIVADRTDDQGRDAGVVDVVATLEADPDAAIDVTWTSDLAPGEVLLAGTTGEIMLWLADACTETRHRLQVTATDAATGETTTAVTDVTAQHTCVRPIEVTIEEPPAGTTVQAKGDATRSVATIQVRATVEGDAQDLNWTWSSDRGFGATPNGPSGRMELVAEGCEPVTHLVTVEVERDDGSSSGTASVEVEVVPPPCDG